MDWARMLAYITGTVDQELLLRNEYLVAENRILKAQLRSPLRLTDAERTTLAVLLIASVVRPLRKWPM
jgi:putative transposase